MSTGIPGADSVNPVTAILIQQTTDLIGKAPQYMGRYIGSLADPSPYEYSHGEEDGPLHNAGIPMFPIADQTMNVGGSQQDGITDATGNIADLLATFDADYLASLGKEFLVFLDVEEASPTEYSPPLSKEYYLGWSQTLVSLSQTQSGGRFTFLPAVYASQSDTATWQAINDAGQQGAPCYGVWVAAYVTSDADTVPVEWPDWDANPPATDGVQLACSILLWQYAGDFPDENLYSPLDCNMTNPSIDSAQFLQKLILPPSAAPAAG